MIFKYQFSINCSEEALKNKLAAVTNQRRYTNLQPQGKTDFVITKS